ncbi:MAG: long-chain fatty acid--CoA ligase [Gammaproteobacteria bacterium]|jgi:long-chain acyl-CoA synthetase|nr:long-chain fatty acid--CoA ligase [Gammaproteobacteria bacterium]
MAELTEDIISTEIAGTLDGLMLQRIRRSPESLAYRSFDADSKRWRDTRWSEVGEQIARWQAALAAEDLLPGERVAVHLRNSKEWVFFDQAALACGLVVVPLYTDDRPDNIAYIMSDSAVKVLLVQDAAVWQRLGPALAGQDDLQRVLILDGSKAATTKVLQDKRVQLVSNWLPASAAPLQQRNGDPHALASIVYTSGTTGRPKGVMLTHHNMLSIAHSALTMIDVFQEDLFLSFLPLSHTLERTAGYYLPVMSGSAVAYARSILQLAEDLQNIRPTVMIAVPRIFERVFARIQGQLEKQSGFKRTLFNLTTGVGWHRFERQQRRAGWHPRLLLWPLLNRLVATKITAKLGGRLRLSVSGGAALSRQVAQIFIGLGVPILQGYGLTETSPVISVNVPEDNEPGSVGIPLNGVDVRIGEDEELLVKTPGMMRGYWNNHAATLEIIDADGWLHTGDQARIDNGHIYITGRIKDILVLSNGEKVPPMDMELAISLVPAIEQVLVIGEGESFLAAIAVLGKEEWRQLASRFKLDADDTASLNNERLQSYLLNEIKGRLKDFPGYAKVRRLILSLEPWTVDNGLLTPTLKVKRARVLDKFAEEIKVLYEKDPVRR